MIETKTVCSFPGCRRVVIHGRCAEHRRRTGESRNRPGDPFYSSIRWRKLRAAKLADDPCCADCRRKGRTRGAEEVHHVVPRSVDASREFDWANLESLCKTCHSRRTLKDMNG